MTANQIAYQANMIQRENYAAQLRESERHNKEMERLEDERNAITSTLGAMADQRERENLAYKREIESKLREREIANAEKRTLIDQDLADLKWVEEARQKWYSDETLKLMKQDRILEQKKIDLQEEFQSFQQSSKWYELGLTEQQIAIQNKNIEYQHQDRVESNAVARDSYISQRNLEWSTFLWQREQQRRTLSQQWEINTLNYGLNQRELELKRQQWETQRKLYNAQTFNYIVTPIIGRNGLVNDTLEGIKMFNGFVSPAVKAAKLLFK